MAGILKKVDNYADFSTYPSNCLSKMYALCLSLFGSYNNTIDLVAYKQQNILSHSFEIWKSEVREPTWLCSGESPLLRYKEPTRRVLSRKREKSLSNLFEKATNSTYEDSSLLTNYLPKSPLLNAIILGFNFNIRNWDWHKHSVHNTPQTSIYLVVVWVLYQHQSPPPIFVILVFTIRLQQILISYKLRCTQKTKETKTKPTTITATKNRCGPK